MHKVTPLPFFPLPPPTYVHPIFPLSSFSLPFGQTADMDVLGCWPSSVHLPGYSRTHTHTHNTTIQLLSLGKLQTSRWMFRAVGPHQYSAAQENQTTQVHAIPTLTGPFNLIPLPLLTTPTPLYNICPHMHIKITAILHTKLTIPLHSHNTFTHMHTQHTHRERERERRIHRERHMIHALVSKFYPTTRSHA